MVNFPTSLDSLLNPGATDTEDQLNLYHDVQHSNANDAIEALEAKVGIDASAVTTSHDYKLARLTGLGYPPATGGEDDDFEDGSFTGWTTMQGAVSLTVTEERGRCSVVHPGTGSGTGDFHGRLKAHSFSNGDWIEAAIRVFGRSQNYNMGGLTFSNGTSHGTSNAIHWMLYPSGGSAGLRIQQNALWLNDTANTDYVIMQNAQGFSDVYLRFMYVSSNTWRGYASCDGISWLNFTGDYAYTMTPTHVGFAMTTWSGTAYPWCMSLAYFRVGNG